MTSMRTHSMLRRAFPFMVAGAALALPFPATASSSLNCFGSAAGKTVFQVHATMDCTLEDEPIPGA